MLNKTSNTKGKSIFFEPLAIFLFEGLDPNQYQDILVMDEDHIKLLDASGNIKNELFDSQIRKFRGLTYANLDGKNTIITTEKTRQGHLY